MIPIKNLYALKEAPENSETFFTLFQNHSCKIESICSWLKTPGEIYDQDEDEWVLLIRGEAKLKIGTVEYNLIAGDYCLLPKHTLHQVVSTSKNALWLGIFSS